MPRFAHHRLVLFALLVVPRRVLAFPLLYHTSRVTYGPLIVVSISLVFFLLVFLAVKLVYMKHRRIGTIHAPPGSGAVHSLPTDSDLSLSTSSLGLRDKPRNRHCTLGLLVGCLGSPTWETNLMSTFNKPSWREQKWKSTALGYRPRTNATTSSARSGSMRSCSKTYGSGLCLMKSTTDADRFVPASSGPSRIPHAHGGDYGDFGESRGVRSPRHGLPNIARRASPSSIRLVDGPSQSNQVHYSFLSGFPPNTLVPSPLMGTRDSFQLSRCSLKCTRKPVPPMPPMPLFLPFCLPDGPDTMESQPCRASEYLPPLQFSPLTTVANVFYSQQKKALSSRVPDPSESKNDIPATSRAQEAKTTESPTSSAIPTRKADLSNHKRSQSCKGLAISGTLPQSMAAVLSPLPQEDKGCCETESTRTPSCSSHGGSVVSKKPLKSCLRQTSITSAPLVYSSDSIRTPSLWEGSTRTHSLATRGSIGDSLRTPISDVDIRILGLDRFRWTDENREPKVGPGSLHTKKDSVVLVPYWE